MRFLINVSSASKPIVTRNTASLPVVASARNGNVSSVAAKGPVTSGCTASAVKKKWGQQCGVSCGCVVRFEIQLDDHDRVVSAEYTAKRILMNSLTANQSQPLFSNRTGRLLYQPSNCKALHQLSSCAVNYFVNRPLWQLMNYHEFQHSRSSESFRRYVLAVQNLSPSDSSKQDNQSKLMHPKKKTKQPENYNHCFDLVEDAITGLLKGYVPPPRPPSQTRWNGQRALAQYTDEYHDASDYSSVNDDDTFSLSNEAVVDTGKNVSTSIPWLERSPHSSALEIPWLLSWKSRNESDRDEDNVVVSTFPVRNNMNNDCTTIDSKSFRWTALDWMDWFENDREKQQQQIQMREKEELMKKSKQFDGSLLPFSFAADWLAYVDSVHFDSTLSNSEQSA